MTSAALLADADTAVASRAKAKPGSLHVSKPGDALEAEADHVADVVMSGGRLTGWSLSDLGTGAVQRQGAGTSVPAPPNYLVQPHVYSTGDMLEKAAEAILQTPAGKRVISMVKRDPLVKSTGDFIHTPAGIVVMGAGALSIGTALAARHQALPAQLPAVPLGIPGLTARITLKGPLDHPKEFLFGLRYSGSHSGRQDTESGSHYRAETARLASELHQFDPSQPAATLTSRAPDWLPKHAAPLPGAITAPAHALPGRPHSETTAPGAPLLPPRLMPQAHAHPGLKPPTLLDRHLELKPLALHHAADEAAAHGEKKREEWPVQRKADHTGDVCARPELIDAALNSSSRPLDAATRRFMEARIGFDFSRVRVHEDSRAAASAHALGARAFTVGHDVVFAAGQYAPGTHAGRRLLAHELAHVVQQRGAVGRAHPVIHAAPRQVQRAWNLKGPKQWLLDKLKTLPGYSLFCLLIGKDLVTDRPVDRTPAKVTEAVLKLVPGGDEVLARFKEVASAIDRAYEWLSAEITSLGLTADYFTGLFRKAWDAADILDLQGSWDRITAMAREPYDKLIALASRALNKGLECVIEAALASINASGIMDVFRKGRDTIKIILNDPGAFLGHLIDAVKGGVSQFGQNVLTHLKEGLLEWLFGSLKFALPKSITPASIFSMVLKVLDLTYDSFKQRLVDALGEPAMQFLEGAFDIITTIYQKGFGAVADRILEYATGLLDSVVGSVRDWVVTRVIVKGVAKLAGMFSPVSGLINVITVIYNVVTFFMEKARALKAWVNSVIDSVHEVATGNIARASDAIEASMARAVPLLINFIAGQIGLSNVGEKVRETIKGIKDKVSQAVDKFFTAVLAKGRALWAKGKEGFKYVKDWWTERQPAEVDGEKHEVYIAGEADHVKVMVHSADSPLELFLKDVGAEPAEAKKILALAAKLQWRKGPREKPDSSETKARQIFDDITQLLRNIKSVKRAHKAPEPDYGGLHAFGGGLRADAWLTAYRDVGSEPGGKDPPIWNDLGPEFRLSRRYVRGHLLSMRLGGAGVWKNMMPITHNANQTMEKRVESHLKSALSSGKRYFHYTVRATYENSPEKPRGPESAEKRLGKISWTVQPAIYEGGAFKEDKGPLLDDKGNKIDMLKNDSVDATM